MTIPQIIKDNELEKEFNYLFGKNSSNSLPYHNLRHTLTVLKNCNEGAYFHSLGISDRRNLLVAAIFHDFNHSGGLLTDEENVKLAKIAFYDFLRDSDSSYINEMYTEEDMFSITDIISATQYPYVIPSEKLNVSQAIIRDADVCQIFEPDWISQVFYGLCKEMNVEDKLSSCEKQKSFLLSIKPNTSWGKWRWSKLEEHLEELEEFKSILECDLPKTTA